MIRVMMRKVRKVMRVTMICCMRLTDFTKRLKLMNKMLKMALTGCLMLEKLLHMIHPMSFVLLHIESSFFTFSPNITVSTHSLLSVMESGTKKKFIEMQCMTCTISAMHVALERSGDTCGHAGTHLKCGVSGRAQHHPTFHAFTQP